MTLHVAVVTGGRADYGLLAAPMRLLRDDPRFRLSVIATGQHLAPAPMGTLHLVTGDGFEVAERVDIVEAGDDALSRSIETGRAVGGVAGALAGLAPDLVLLLGDRYEILGAALAAHMLRIPIAHIAGGDVTEGAVDDAFRHSITKLSHLHFVTTPDAARRVRQLGEDPARVHVVGSPGLDAIRDAAIPARDAFFAAVGLTARRHNLLVTFHPATAAGDPVADVTEMLAAFTALGPDFGFVFTGVNLDTGGRSVEAAIRAFCTENPGAVFHDALGAKLYYGGLTHCDVVVGNSSSGLYEAPSFKRPTVNIGTRQDGRVRAASVIDVGAVSGDIVAAVRRAIGMDCSGVTNPYGDGHAGERIVAILAGLDDMKALLGKRFVDL